MRPEIAFPTTCSECGEETYSFERYCHCCGADRWEHVKEGV